MQDYELNLATLSHLFVDEDKAREFIEAKRWPNGPVCPRCGSTDVVKLTAKPGSRRPVRDGVYKCYECRRNKQKSIQFTVRIGTIFEESKLPLSKWLMAIHLMCSSKKGVSSHQIARELGITVKSAWFLTHRIREAMKKEPMASMLAGTVEVDETYVGGKPRYKGENKRGRGTGKQPVMVLVERDGNAKVTPVENVKGDTLVNEVVVNVAKETVVMTDELGSYNDLEKCFKHKSINHSQEEWVRKEKDGTVVHTNTAESFFALLKRGHYGIFHHLSKKHLHRYCTEFGFRWNQRKVTDGERMVEAIVGAEGKRLFYQKPIKSLN